MPETAEELMGQRRLLVRTVTILRSGPRVAWVEDESGQQYYARLADLQPMSRTPEKP